MMIRPDEEQHEHADGDYEAGEQDYDVEDSDEEQDDIDDDDVEQDEEQYEQEQRFLRSLVKVQALIRGFLTRKMIFEHLQRMVQENQLMYQNENGGVMMMMGEE